jgi:adenosylmethionine-8-amino-7-oxononanoate aminotransferase
MVIENEDSGVFYRNRRRSYPVATHGEGIYLYDSEGNRYIDAVGGAVVVNIGHGVQEVVQAMAEQAAQLCFAHVGRFSNPAQEELAEKVLRMAPRGMGRVYFTSGGSEAVEMAIKIARQYHLERGQPERCKIVSLRLANHGSTMGAFALSGITHRKSDYQPYLISNPQVHPPYCYRCAYGMEYPACGLHCAHEIDRVIELEGPGTVAAFIAEPVMGAGCPGLTPPQEYFPLVHSICKKHEVLFMVDEVMTGFGRTGANFGIDHWNLCPDIIACGKGISGGYTPLGAVVVHRDIYDLFLDSARDGFFMGHTYSGNPLSCAVGSAVLSYMDKHGLVERSASMGEYLWESLLKLKAHPTVGEIRGKGLLLGIELVAERGDRKPFPAHARFGARVAEEAFRLGMLIYEGSPSMNRYLGDHILLAPPFIVTEEEVEEIVTTLDEALRRAEMEQVL